MATINKTMKTLNVPSGNDTVCYEIVDEAIREAIGTVPTGHTVMGDISDVKSAFDSIATEEKIYADPIAQSDFTRLLNKSWYNKTIQDKNGYSLLYCQAPTTGTYRLIFSTNNAQNSARVYTGTDFLTSQYVRSATAVSNKEKNITAEAGQYIVLHAWSLDFTADVQLQTGVEYDVSQIDEKITAEENNIFPTGWAHFPVEDFSRNEWTGYSSTSSRNYRVKYNNVVRFNRPTFLRAKLGFYVTTYTTASAYSGTRTIFLCLANTDYKVNIRRKNENSSEIADIEEFADALEYSTPLAGIESHKLTFSDISMFERVGIGGDSYASGGGIISGIRSLTWGKNLERQAGIAVDIYAKSGQNVMQWVVDSTNGLPALLAGNQCGLYWLQHGINGTSTDEEFGSLDDITTYPHPNTFCGQYTEAIEQIKTGFPKSRIIMATIIGSSYALYQGSQYAKVNNAIRAIAEYCEVMLVDVADDDFYRTPWYSGWTRSNHPTAMQNAGIAMANRRLISKCIQDNPDYFVNYGT